jgi:hypothetical protein
MTALYNTLSDGTTTCNYVNAVIKGELLLASTYDLPTLLNQRFGINTSIWNTIVFGTSTRLLIRFPAGGLEKKTGAMTTVSNYRLYLTRTTASANGHLQSSGEQISTHNSNSDTIIIIGTGSRTSGASERTFFCLNDYALLVVSFTDATLNTLAEWRYYGWTKDIPNDYDNATVYPRTFTFIKSSSSQYLRPTSENTTSGTTSFSTAANAITNPALNCSIVTPGATWGDCKLRDVNSPNFSIGKLHHVIEVEATHPIGSVIVDQNGQAYIVFVNWGSRRLAFKVFAEGYGLP